MTFESGIYYFAAACVFSELDSRVPFRSLQEINK